MQHDQLTPVSCRAGRVAAGLCILTELTQTKPRPAGGRFPADAHHEAPMPVPGSTAGIVADQLYTPREAASFLPSRSGQHVSVSTLFRWMRRGILHDVRKVGAHTFIPGAEIIRLLQQQREPGHADQGKDQAQGERPARSSLPSASDAKAILRRFGMPLPN